MRRKPNKKTLVSYLFPWYGHFACIGIPIDPLHRFILFVDNLGAYWHYGACRQNMVLFGSPVNRLIDCLSNCSILALIAVWYWLRFPVRLLRYHRLSILKDRNPFDHFPHACAMCGRVGVASDLIGGSHGHDDDSEPLRCRCGAYEPMLEG